MDIKSFLIVFATVFIAELGDKTQLATFIFASNQENNKYMVFLAASLALIISAALGVLAASALSYAINQKVLSIFGGILFIVLGIITLVKAYSLS